MSEFATPASKRKKKTGPVDKEKKTENKEKKLAEKKSKPEDNDKYLSSALYGLSSAQQVKFLADARLAQLTAAKELENSHPAASPRFASTPQKVQSHGWSIKELTQIGNATPQVRASQTSENKRQPTVTQPPSALALTEPQRPPLEDEKLVKDINDIFMKERDPLAKHILDEPTDKIPVKTPSILMLTRPKKRALPTVDPGRQKIYSLLEEQSRIMSLELQKEQKLKLEERYKACLLLEPGEVSSSASRLIKLCIESHRNDVVIKDTELSTIKCGADFDRIRQMRLGDNKGNSIRQGGVLKKSFPKKGYISAASTVS